MPDARCLTAPFPGSVSRTIAHAPSPVVALPAAGGAQLPVDIALADKHLPAIELEPDAVRQAVLVALQRVQLSRGEPGAVLACGQAPRPGTLEHELPVGREGAEHAVALS